MAFKGSSFRSFAAEKEKQKQAIKSLDIEKLIKLIREA